MTDWRPGATRATLVHRAAMLDRIRSHFASSGALEVEVPILQSAPNRDPNIPVARLRDSERWFITSPEHPLKRLVAAGYGAVWTCCPCLRPDELGAQHEPLFTMLEWYRPGWDERQLLEEVAVLATATTGLGGGCVVHSFRQRFQDHLGVDPLDDDAVLTRARAENGPVGDDPDTARDWLLATHLQPALGTGRWEALIGWPPAGAGQARVFPDPADGRPVAARFEVYRDGIEIANGYHEATDADELRQRMAAVACDGPLDERLLAAVPRLGPCAGVAVGFDRLVLLALGLERLAESRAFSWSRA